MIIGIIIGALILLGAVAYFFVEFEDIDDEEFVTSEHAEEEADPYAWGRKEAVETPQPQPVVVSQQATPQASGQHPGWLWDQESNQWVPDPNYQSPNQ